MVWQNILRKREGRENTKQKCKHMSFKITSNLIYLKFQSFFFHILKIFSIQLNRKNT